MFLLNNLYDNEKNVAPGGARTLTTCSLSDIYILGHDENVSCLMTNEKYSIFDAIFQVQGSRPCVIYRGNRFPHLFILVLGIQQYTHST